MCCGEDKPESKFFKSRHSSMWVQDDHFVMFCRDCVEKYFIAAKERTHSTDASLKSVCAIMDWPFYAALYRSMAERDPNFTIGEYGRNISMAQYKNKSFIDSIIDGEFYKTQEVVREEREARWSSKDKQNMRYAVSVVGYDPFDIGGFSDEDRKYCFNVLAGYCDSDGIREDSHKRQAAIQATQIHLQIKKIDDAINEELCKVHADESRLRSLSETKTKLLKSLSNIAQDNNFASNYNDSSKAGRNTLSMKMKEMEEDGYSAIKANLFDIKTCAAMRQIADLSNQSLMEQLAFDTNDYAGMVKDQRQMIVDLTARAESAEEELRMCKNKIIDLENAKKRK